MRMIFIASLALVATSACAEWAKVAESGDAMFYIDPATVRTNGNLRQVWQIQDFLEQRPNGARSRRLLVEFDCGAERWRTLSITEHSEPMGGGSVLASSSGESQWIYVAPITGSNLPPRTPNRTIRKVVCSR